MKWLIIVSISCNQLIYDQLYKEILADNFTQNINNLKIIKSSALGVLLSLIMSRTIDLSRFSGNSVTDKGVHMNEDIKGLEQIEKWLKTQTEDKLIEIYELLQAQSEDDNDFSIIED